jgi:hypothetical protein
MTDREGVDRARWGTVELVPPWTCAGEPDPDYDDAARTCHQALLTDPQLLTCFRRRFPEHGAVSYDDMVRLLGYVWDCPHDGTANVTGHRCAACGRTRAAAHASGRPPLEQHG